MLRDLSGNLHTVITGVCVADTSGGSAPIREHRFTSCTEVEFKSLRDAEIDAYVASGEPMDKAGAYAIQGRGAYMIRRINGSYTNVVGLPLGELVDVLEREFGVFPTPSVHPTVTPR
jgi:septum formation protein